MSAYAEPRTTSNAVWFGYAGGRASAWASSAAASGRSGPSPASLGTPEAGAGGLRAAKGEAPPAKAFLLAGPTWKAPARSDAGSGLRGGGSRRGRLGDRARAWGGTWGPLVHRATLLGTEVGARVLRARRRSKKAFSSRGGSWRGH